MLAPVAYIYVIYKRNTYIDICIFHVSRYRDTLHCKSIDVYSFNGQSDVQQRWQIRCAAEVADQMCSRWQEGREEMFRV